MTISPETEAYIANSIDSIRKEHGIVVSEDEGFTTYVSIPRLVQAVYYSPVYPPNEEYGEEDYWNHEAAIAACRKIYRMIFEGEPHDKRVDNWDEDDTEWCGTDAICVDGHDLWVEPGEFLVRDENGEFRVFSREEFAEKYLEVERGRTFSIDPITHFRKINEKSYKFRGWDYSELFDWFSIEPDTSIEEDFQEEDMKERLFKVLWQSEWVDNNHEYPNVEALRCYVSNYLPSSAYGDQVFRAILSIPDDVTFLQFIEPYFFRLWD